MDFSYLVNDAAEGKVLEVVTTQNNLGVFLDPNAEALAELLFPENGKVRIYCTKCKQVETFDVSLNVRTISGDTFSTESSPIVASHTKSYSNGETAEYARALEPTNRTWKNFEIIGALKDIDYYFFYSLVCDFDCKTNYTLLLRLSCRENKATLYKVGQVPPLYVISNSDASEYRPLLEEMNAYDDYLFAVRCHQNHMDAGACCYLRRVINAMIKYYKAKCAAPIEDNLRTEDKLNILEKNGIIESDAKEAFDSLYSTLSEGDHSLGQEEDAKYYPDFIAAVDLQLTEETLKREQAKKKAEIKNRTSAIRQEIEERKKK